MVRSGPTSYVISCSTPSNYLRNKLGPKKSDEAWRQGLAMDLERAIDYALEEHGLADAARIGPLSRREVEVARLLTRGMTNRQIAQKLFLSEHTVEGQLDRIRNKLALRSRTEVAGWAVSQRAHRLRRL
jgi:DNA-binding NarL/FixJ family response regulator